MDDGRPCVIAESLYAGSQSGHVWHWSHSVSFSCSVPTFSSASETGTCRLCMTFWSPHHQWYHHHHHHSPYDHHCSWCWTGRRWIFDCWHWSMMMMMMPYCHSAVCYHYYYCYSCHSTRQMSMWEMWVKSMTMMMICSCSVHEPVYQRETRSFSWRFYPDLVMGMMIVLHSLLLNVRWMYGLCRCDKRIEGGDDDLSWWWTTVADVMRRETMWDNDNS